jgi:Putative zincin peptidase
MDNFSVQFKLTAQTMNIICWLLLISPLMFYLVLNIAESGVEGLFSNVTSVHSLQSIPVLITVYVIHEALHALGGMIVGIKLSSFNFGFDKKSLSIECGCDEQMTLKAYYFMLLLPFLVLTPLITGLAFYTGSHLWWIMLVISTSGCAFDLTVFLGLWGVPTDTKIIPELKGENGYVYMRAGS